MNTVKTQQNKLSAGKNQAALMESKVAALCLAKLKFETAKEELEKAQSECMGFFVAAKDKQGNPQYNMGLRIASQYGTVYLSKTGDSLEWLISDEKAKEIRENFTAEQIRLKNAKKKSHPPHFRYDWKPVAQAAAKP